MALTLVPEHLSKVTFRRQPQASLVALSKKNAGLFVKNVQPG